MSEKRAWRPRLLGGLMMAGPWGSGSGKDGDNPKPGGSRNPWAQPVGRPGGTGRPSVDSASEKLRELFGVGTSTGGGGGGGGGGGRLPRHIDRSVWIWGAVAIVVIWLLFTSFHRIGPGERGVVQRFGQYQSTLSPGVGLTFPSPIDRVTVVNVDEIRTIPIGSTAEDNQKLVLTSDQNITDMAYTIRWKISSPERYLFQIADQEQVIRDTAESAMRAVVANYTLDQAIGPGREEIAALVAERAQEILNAYNAGINIEGVEINQADPPAAVNDAFKKVTEAQQNAERDLNDARAYSQQVTALAQGEAESFDKVFEQYRLAPEVTRRRMYYETMEQVLQKMDKTIVEVPGVVPYLQTQPNRPSAPVPLPPPAAAGPSQ